MIVSSENTNSSEQIPPKQKHFWLKLSLVIAIIFFIVWLIPYLFSNLLFSTAIKKAFSNLSKQQYTLTFDDIKINLFTRKITFYNTHIKQSKKDINADELNVGFYSDTLIFQKINFRTLRKKQLLKIEKVQISHLKFVLENKTSLANQQKLLYPLNTHLNQLFIQNFQLTKAEIIYKQEKDSIHIPNLNLHLSEIQIDSLKDTVKTNRFHFGDINLILKNQQFQLPNKSHFISWEQLKLSTEKKDFELDNLIIKPLQSDNKKQAYTADIPKLILHHFDFDSLIKHKQLLTKNLFLDINLFNIHFNGNSREPTTLNFKQQLDTFFEENFNRIAIDSGQITIAKGQINLHNNQQVHFLGKTKLYVNNFQFNPENKEKFSLNDGEILIKNIAFSNPTNKQKAQLKQVQLSYADQTLNIQGINFISDTTTNINLQLEEIKLTKIDWVQLLNRDELLAETFYLYRGNFIQKYAAKSKSSFFDLAKVESLLSPFLHFIRIKNIQFEDWNYQLASKAIHAKNINAQLHQFQLPSSSNLAFGTFADFNSKINQFSWVSNDQRHHYLIKEIETNSLTQHINIAEIQSFPRWKTLKNELIEEKARFKIFGEHIKIKTQDPFSQIRLDKALLISQLSVDSLNLKQYGKKISEEKLKSSIPPIFISSFELHEGNFSAYNDSSILNRLAQINGIHLRGDSLEIYSDSLFLINYKRLIAFTENGFYQNKAQGLNFNFQKINFDSEGETMGIHQVKAELSSDKNDKSTLHQLNSKLVEIKGFDHNLFLQRNLISAKEFKLNSPTLKSKSQSQNKQQANFRDLFSTENLQNLPYLEFDRFIVRDFTWLATYTVKGITNITTFENTNFEALDFRLSNQSFTNPERLFFSQSINFHIGNLKQHLQNGNYLLMVANVDFSSLQKQMVFDKILFYTLLKTGQNNYNFTIDQISFNKINFADFQRNYSLSIENIVVKKPKTNLRLFGFEESSRVKNLNALELYSSLEPYFSQISLKRIDILDMNLKLEIPKGSSTNTYNLGHLNLQMHNFKLDSTSKAFQNNRFFYTQNTLVHLRDYSAHIENNLYRVNFKDLRLSTLDGIIEIDSFQLKPQYNYADFAKRVAYQTDRFDIEINSVKLSGIDFQDALFRQKYTVRKAEINQLTGEAFRDGLYPRLPNYRPPNPIQRLLALPYFIQVDSIYLNNAYFTYKERGIHTHEPGLIFFDQLNAQILNVSNNPDFIKFGGNTVLNAQALLMGTGKLSLDVNFPLLEQGKVFKLNANLSQIEMDDLKPILRPLALIQARSGTIKSVELSVEANDDYAFGNMLMLYNNMKVDILKKSMKKGFLSSLFANALIRTENTNQLFPRKGPIYFERNKMRSIFNYWAEISILGMKTSMGLADRRTAKKVKKLQGE